MPSLRNLMEIVVMAVVDEMIPAGQICRCEKCRLDVAALALNELPPRYVVTDRGESYARADFLETQRNVDIVHAVCVAIRKVSAYPHHDAAPGDSPAGKITDR